MPYYDFRCLSCQRKVTLFYKNFAAYDEAAVAATHTCPKCGSAQLTRRIGRVAVAKGEDARMDALGDETALAGLDPDDPRALGRYMRQMSGEMGEDLGDEFHEVVDRLEKGQSPEQIEQALPGLADSVGGAGGNDFGF
ncbi:MAG: hypothetical protein IPL28_00895 [Chloroflexi bacterium]|nr:hypothetical protein [Chloroflexota bacterium]